MLGHLNPRMGDLPGDCRKIYKTVYCSICRCIHRRYGVHSTLFVNNELTLMLMSVLPELQGQKIDHPCPLRGYLSCRQTIGHPAIDLAADYALSLGSVKILDNDFDSRNYATRLMVRTWKDAYQKAVPEHRRHLFEAYLVSARENNFDEIVQRSGVIAQCIFEDISKKLEQRIYGLSDMASICFHVGRILPLADALIDLKGDKRRGRYNPIVESSESSPGLSEAYQHFFSLCQTELDALWSGLKKQAFNSHFQTALSASLTGLERKISRSTGKMRGITSE